MLTTVGPTWSSVPPPASGEDEDLSYACVLHPQRGQPSPVQAGGFLAVSVPGADVDDEVVVVPVRSVAAPSPSPTTVLLPPAVLQHLQIRSPLPPMHVTLRAVPQPPPTRAAAAVTLARLVGRLYPRDEDEERVLLQGYFDAPTRRVATGGLVVVGRPDADVYVYVIADVTAATDAPAAPDALLMAIRGETKVVLKGKCSRRLVDMNVIRDHHRYTHRMQYTKRDLWDAPANQLAQALAPVMDVFERASRRCTAGPAPTAAALVTLVASPLLVESTYSDGDLRALCAGAADTLGLGLAALDARAFLDPPSTTTTTTTTLAKPPAATVLAALPGEVDDALLLHTARCARCGSVEGSDIVRSHAPCVLLLTGVDDVLFGGLLGAPPGETGAAAEDSDPQVRVDPCPCPQLGSHHLAPFVLSFGSLLTSAPSFPRHFTTYM